MRNSCPACGGQRHEAIIDLPNLPIHGTAIYESADDARNAPRGDQSLAFCLDCGLVFNTRFEASLLDYGGRHASSQHHSPRFAEYARGLAETWVRDYGLEGSAGCEIGAGDGAFVALLLAAGVGRMTAIDPALSDEDLAPELRNRVRVHRDFFEPSHLAVDTRFVCSRHTFEHIPDVGPFLQMLAGAMRDSGTPLLLSEVPDLGRVLRHGAFWDLEYEHCSYFTPSTLLASFAACGFDGGSARLTYEDQYVVAEASLDGTLPRIGAVTGPELECLHDLAMDFRARVKAGLERWSNWFADRAAAGDEVALWGGGSKGLTFLNTLRPAAVRRVVDINPGLQGHYIGGLGLPICEPELLRREPPRHVVLMNPVYRDEVRGTLNAMGLTATELTTMEV